MTDAQPQTPTAKVGRLTRDPEIRVSAAGKPWATFGLAVERPVTPGDWKGEKVTDFYEVTTFGSLAEHVSECLAKGDRVVVVGRGELDKWIGKDGVERTTKKIIADGVGPDLRFNGAEIQRTEHREPATVGQDAEAF